VSTVHDGLVDVPTHARLQEPGDAFAQLLSRGGATRATSDGFTTSLLTPAELGRISRPTFLQRRVRNFGTARLLALPVAAGRTADVLVVGATMTDRTDALNTLRRVLLLGGPAAIALACLAGWLVAGLALHPMERLRQQAAAITSSGLDHRLSVPAARDELRSLAETLNDMLQRLDHSFRHEREFLERASHELRTPLTALRAETDLALSHPRNADELTAALRSVSEETDRLAHLAEDLLLLARTSNGMMALHREPIALHETLKSAAALFAARARQEGITLTVQAPEETISADPLRLRQALVNLLDNALRHTPSGGTIHLTAEVTDTATHIVVSDSGSGFTRSAGDLDEDYGGRHARTSQDWACGSFRQLLPATTEPSESTATSTRAPGSNSPCPSPSAVNQPRLPDRPCHTPEQPPQPRLGAGPDIAGRANRRPWRPSAPIVVVCSPVRDARVSP
jgi:signal transduction histidine kinase